MKAFIGQVVSREEGFCVGFSSLLGNRSNFVRKAACSRVAGGGVGVANYCHSNALRRNGIYTDSFYFRRFRVSGVLFKVSSSFEAAYGQLAWVQQLSKVSKLSSWRMLL
ncbi:hypothetical protein CDAR_307491 [Caerostris darwini]|uniref:Uncharacterized protein n=1 Tax=Caerostris darwini TaxID=1538125 RepID=A0AAV4T2A2_9ARAC|nr:hypothetical protein CDAR_307491 [Caerostris darwini]